MNQICPECETENPETAKRCSKCDYPLAAQRDFERMANATAKKRKKETKVEEPEKEDDGGFFGILAK